MAGASGKATKNKANKTPGKDFGFDAESTLASVTIVFQRQNGTIEKLDMSPEDSWKEVKQDLLLNAASDHKLVLCDRKGNTHTLKDDDTVSEWMTPLTAGATVKILGINEDTPVDPVPLLGLNVRDAL